MPVTDIENIEHWNDFIRTQSGGGSTGSSVFVVDFYATWCGPCKAIKPKYHQLSEAYNIPFLSVDIDKLEPVAEKFSITSMPTFAVVKNGEIVKTVVGGDLLAVQIGIDNAIAGMI